MPAPIGNQNAAKAKQWTAAIERALERLGDPSIDPDKPIPRSPRAKAIDQLADVFVSRVGVGDLAFFREFGDRLDGKPGQQVILAGDSESPLIHKIVREVVKP